MTFDVISDVFLGKNYDWQSHFEICSICRRCHRHAVSVLKLTEISGQDSFKKNGDVVKRDDDISKWLAFERTITVVDNETRAKPDSLPDEISQPFIEGTRCLSVNCPNAASAMFRLCLDIATRTLLPADQEINKDVRRNLPPRLRWLFDEGLLGADLKDLSQAVKEHGDEGVHEGILGNEEAENIYDFAFELLSRMYTMPARLKDAAEKRAARKSN